MLAGQHWKQPQNRRKFFTDFASKSGFDPLVADNWYSIVKETIQAEKVLYNTFFIVIYTLHLGWSFCIGFLQWVSR